MYIYTSIIHILSIPTIPIHPNRYNNYTIPKLQFSISIIVCLSLKPELQNFLYPGLAKPYS